MEKLKEVTALSEEQLDELPISTVVDGEVVTYPNAEAMLDAQAQSSVPATMDDVRSAILHSA